jgi:DNA polymerase I-like protein with 3'-5' exonuclease and polymerase domains
MLSDIKPLAKSCLKIESSSDFNGADVSTLKQYSSVSSLRKNKWYIPIILSQQFAEKSFFHRLVKNARMQGARNPEE